MHLTLYKGIFPKLIYTMKKILFLLVFVLSLSSCSVDDGDYNSFHYEILPIESVDIPQEFVLGETYTIYATYLKPSGCYVFNNFYFDSDLNQRTVAIINTVYENSNCQTFEGEEVEVSFDFKVISNGTYVFRFWQGEDENGNDTYYIIEVPVVE